MVLLGFRMFNSLFQHFCDFRITFDRKPIILEKKIKIFNLLENIKDIHLKLFLLSLVQPAMIVFIFLHKITNAFSFLNSLKKQSKEAQDMEASFLCLKDHSISNFISLFLKLLANQLRYRIQYPKDLAIQFFLQIDINDVI